MSVTVVPARQVHSREIAALSGELGYPLDADAVSERLEWAADRDDHLILVALMENAPCGWIHAARVMSLEGGFAVEILGMVVSETRRGSGIGSQLLQEVLSWARRSGAPRIIARSRSQRVDAHRFYQRHGFTHWKDQAVLYYALSEASGPPSSSPSSRS